MKGIFCIFFVWFTVPPFFSRHHDGNRPVGLSWSLVTPTKKPMVKTGVVGLTAKYWAKI